MNQILKNQKENNPREWYLELLKKSEFIIETKVPGCIVYSPNCLGSWNAVCSWLEEKQKTFGFENYYFPLLIPKNDMIKQKEHFDVFFRELPTVTKVGDTSLDEEYYLRPTSEMIIYPSLKESIRESAGNADNFPNLNNATDS